MSTYKNPPKMRPDLLYEDWKKELKIWQRATELDKKKQGAVLLLSLEGRPRETVLADVPDAAYDESNAVETIIKCLDKLLKKDDSETAFQAFDNFINFRRPKDMSIEKFLQEFSLRNTKIKAQKMTLPDGVLAYAVLKCCNLPEEQSQICRATVSDLTYDNMLAQIKKVALQTSTSSDSQASTSSVSVNYSQNYESSQYDDAYYDESEYWEESESQDYTYQEDQPSDAAEETVKDAFYSQRPRGFPMSRGFRGRPFSRRPSKNGYDDMGNVRTCRYCKSTCHMLLDCPDAPPHLKENRDSYRGQYRGYRYDRGGRGRSQRGRKF